MTGNAADFGVAILSPHRDDAAFSCGLTICALLRAGAKVTIVNVFTQSNYAVDLRTVDASLPAVQGVSAARKLEDLEFLADVTATAGSPAESVCLHDLHHLDAPLRLNIATERVLVSPLTREEVGAEARALAADLTFLRSFDLAFIPLALGDHIDHRVARDAACTVVPPECLCFYEDLPYAARMDAAGRKIASIHAVSSQAGQGTRRHSLHLPRGAHLKRRFALHYLSQIAPEVAGEMAAYADRGKGLGAEAWWATLQAADRLRQVLAHPEATARVIEERD